MAMAESGEGSVFSGRSTGGQGGVPEASGEQWAVTPMTSNLARHQHPTDGNPVLAKGFGYHDEGGWGRRDSVIMSPTRLAHPQQQRERNSKLKRSSSRTTAATVRNNDEVGLMRNITMDSQHENEREQDGSEVELRHIPRLGRHRVR